MGAHGRQPVAQQLSDAPKAQHQTPAPQQRPFQAFQNHLDCSLRRGGGIGHCQFFASEIVDKLQVQLRRKGCLGRLHLSRQDQLIPPKLAEQRPRAPPRAFYVQGIPLLAQRQRQNHHLRRYGSVPIHFSGHAAGRHCVSVPAQQRQQFLLSAVTADDSKQQNPRTPLPQRMTPTQSCAWISSDFSGRRQQRIPVIGQCSVHDLVQ